MAGRAGYVPVPIEGLERTGMLSFPLFLQTGPDGWVLYREADTVMGPEHVMRLEAEGVECLYIRESDRGRYFAHVEGTIDKVLRNKTLPVEARADVLHGVATHATSRVFSPEEVGHLDRARVQSVSSVLAAGGTFLLREPDALRAIRRLLEGSDDLVQHSLTVAVLSMGLTKVALGNDPAVIVQAGLAGLLHDIGRVHGLDEEDEAHVAEGERLLRGLDLPDAVLEAVRDHHERYDGGGWPRGKAGDEISPIAQIVALVDAFDRVYTFHKPRIGVFETMRILARTYRGCFDMRLAGAFISLFE